MEYLLFACGVSMLLFTCAQLLSQDKQPVHYCMAIGSFALAYQLLYFWASETGVLMGLPALYASHIPWMFLGAPAFYLSALTIMHGGIRPVRSYVAYFGVPLLLTLGFGIYNAVTAPTLLRVRRALPGYFEIPFHFWLTAAAYLAFTAAVAFALIAAFRLHKAGVLSKKRLFRSQVVFLFFYLAASILLFLSCVLRDKRLLLFSAALFGCIATGFTLTCTGIAYFSGKSVLFPSRRTSHWRSWDGSEKGLSSRLDLLMEESAPYKDPDLTLRRLAFMLGVDAKRLSRFFNASLSTTFRGYINERRLRAVCRGLLENPDAPILDTAFANGFNSKSSFNTLFIEAYGMSPREYRSARSVPGKSSDKWGAD